ncbi:bacteriohemerythrin [Desulfovibrio gilichinskyi]|uniref:Hemerythrin n=1 Tax=Desulfovibrio gilichinskyi TaxID=1519643 RepID=A0A1X7CA69_9BACT|nr:bacteriohemerythrin [Desulfovibrio gilichinskyi]SME92751.1 hemerythrin [Desulfovibrio gilichinskyi]
MASNCINGKFLCTGFGLVDSQHNNFIKLLERIRSQIPSANKGEIDLILDELFLYSLYHFETEERLLEKYNLESFPKHLEQHREYTEKMEQFKIDCLLEKAELTLEIIEFLEQWLINHIKETDVIDFQAAQKIDDAKM